MKCEYCDSELPVGASRCPSCGAALKSPVPAAPAVTATPAQSASVAATPNVQVVINNVAAATPYAPPPPIVYKKRMTFVLLGVFLGCFGVHNFYAGFAVRGVSQLLLSLILLATPLSCLPVYLWVIFELLFITEDARSVRMV